eukprot:3754802-Pyramimonas_sp.AAC.1
MGGEPQTPSSGVQGATGKAACAPAIEAAPPSVHAPRTTSGTPEAGESPARTKGGAPGSDDGHRPEGERQRKRGPPRATRLRLPWPPDTIRPQPGDQPRALARRAAGAAASRSRAPQPWQRGPRGGDLRTGHTAAPDARP